jgi:acetylornithine deacetylase/succinyl-diaminopimelate desuccinylase-like protein
MQEIHTVKEWLRVGDMIRTAEVIAEMLRLHAAPTG